MSKVINMVNQKFGRLLVVSRAYDKGANGNARWNCVCDCGKHIVADGYSLRHGITRSCGCLRREMSSQAAKCNEAFVANQGNPMYNEDGIAYSSLYKGKRNRTGVIGVSFDNNAQRFVARLMFHGRYVLNHMTPDFEEAVRLRKEAEERYFKHPVK
ncbi:AP2 domain-containing protein [Secundilactobacillus mixtipabuli]|uniref:Uncharacterized protein n=1 Tax=Secundilactobacillus mixtipabuli TaxID=1435342 RepID=A0A1Z5IED8_9LACO|nr:AP2 domain-containing protein [Secundilactobacillus mixtipabuli]GAX00083.1 hypothetical protein IWT30_02063 [Secundilactobacillus mixtipabuli]